MILSGVEYCFCPLYIPPSVLHSLLLLSINKLKHIGKHSTRTPNKKGTGGVKGVKGIKQWEWWREKEQQQEKQQRQQKEADREQGEQSEFCTSGKIVKEFTN